MGILLPFTRRHARAPLGKRSGRSCDRETPVSRSIGKTNSAATPRFDLVNQYQTCPCVVPIALARRFWPPARSQASSRAALRIMESNYPILGDRQPKTMSQITKLKFGNSYDMKQPIDPVEFGRRVREKREELGLSQTNLGKLSGYSQSNIGWFESGRAKDPRIQARDVAEPLRSTEEWLLYGTGTRDTCPPPMTSAEVAQGYEHLTLEERETISALIASGLLRQRKKRKS
jgi:transcriptional regulator with XRE-family HTH domain